MIEDNPISFETSFGFFKLDDNRVITTITVQTENKELHFEDSGGVQVATMNIAGSILNISNRRVNFFEEVVKTTATPQELIDAKERKSAYQKTVILPPGNYKADSDRARPQNRRRRRSTRWLHRAKVRRDSSRRHPLILASVLESVSNPDSFSSIQDWRSESHPEYFRHISSRLAGGRLPSDLQRRHRSDDFAALSRVSSTR